MMKKKEVTKKNMTNELRVVLYPGEDGYIVAECIDIPGCVSQGETQEEALKNVADAAQVCLAVMLEDYISHQSKKRSRRGGTPKTIRITGPQAVAV